MQEKLKEVEEKLTDQTWDVFYGPIYDNTGKVRVGEGENLSDHSLINIMDWYVAGVNIVQ